MISSSDRLSSFNYLSKEIEKLQFSLFEYQDLNPCFSVFPGIPDNDPVPVNTGPGTLTQEDLIRHNQAFSGTENVASDRQDEDVLTHVGEDGDRLTHIEIRDDLTSRSVHSDAGHSDLSHSGAGHSGQVMILILI